MPFISGFQNNFSYDYIQFDAYCSLFQLSKNCEHIVTLQSAEIRFIEPTTGQIVARHPISESEADWKMHNFKISGNGKIIVIKYNKNKHYQDRDKPTNNRFDIYSVDHKKILNR